MGVIALWFVPVAFVRISCLDDVLLGEETLSHLLLPAGWFVEQCQRTVHENFVRFIHITTVVFQM